MNDVESRLTDIGVPEAARAVMTQSERELLVALMDPDRTAADVARELVDDAARDQTQE